MEFFDVSFTYSYLNNNGEPQCQHELINATKIESLYRNSCYSLSSEASDFRVI